MVPGPLTRGDPVNVSILTKAVVVLQPPSRDPSFGPGVNCEVHSVTVLFRPFGQTVSAKGGGPYLSLRPGPLPSTTGFHGLCRLPFRTLGNVPFRIYTATSLSDSL